MVTLIVKFWPTKAVTVDGEILTVVDDDAEVDRQLESP
jgi:hypothetical protein